MDTLYDKNDTTKNEALLKSMRPGSGRRIAEDYSVKNIADCFEEDEDGLAVRIKTPEDLTLKNLTVEASALTELLDDPSLEEWDDDNTLSKYEAIDFGAGSGALLQREASVKRTGDYSAKVIVSPAGDTFKCIIVPYVGSAGDIVNFSLYARKASGGSGELAIAAFNEAFASATQMYDFDAGQWVAYTGGAPSSADSSLTESFVQYEQTIVAPASGKIVFLVVGTGPGDSIAYFDDFSLTSGSEKSTAVFTDGLQTKTFAGELTSTPTDAEFTALIGSPEDKAGLLVIVQDTANNKTYFVTTDGTDWLYSLATKAL